MAYQHLTAEERSQSDILLSKHNSINAIGSALRAYFFLNFTKRLESTGNG
ncbi:MAG: hypothetical protein HAW62_06455, partial [Endozoicomonadaceae bacterium]|nr:hypothetical protein [Endozoicomonadaceae bacterium]